MRFKKNERVFIPELSKYGVVVDCNVKNTVKDGKPFCEVTYLVKPEGATDFGDYQVCTKKDIKKVVNENVQPSNRFWHKEDLGDGFQLLMVGITEDGPLYSAHESIDHNLENVCSTYAVVDEIKKILYVSYTICSKDDEWSWDTGFKIAEHRITKEEPYFRMFSTRYNEFDKETVEAILAIKAKHIKAHRERFINKRGEHFKF